MSTTLVHHVSQNLTDTLRDVFEHNDNSTALVIYDLDSPLYQLLTDAYRQALPYGVFIDFIDKASSTVIPCGDDKLIYPSPFEDAKLNNRSRYD